MPDSADRAFWKTWDLADDYERIDAIQHALDDTTLTAPSLLDLAEKAVRLARHEHHRLPALCWAAYVPKLVVIARAAATPEERAAIDLLIGLGTFNAFALVTDDRDWTDS